MRSNDLMLKCHRHRHKHRRRPPIIISRTICVIIITSALLFLLLHLTSISGTTGKAPLYCQTLGGAINTSIHMHQPRGSFSIKNRTQRSEGLCWQRGVKDSAGREHFSHCTSQTTSWHSSNYFYTHFNCDVFFPPTQTNRFFSCHGLGSK